MRNEILSGRQIAVFALCGGLAAPIPAIAAEYSVPMDQVRMITFQTPLGTIYVGNPLVAGITIVDSTRVFLMGKNFGTTNIVALDASGNQIANDRITVTARVGETVTLHRGSAQTTLSCVGGRCQVAPIPGDAPEEFQAVSDQVTNRESNMIAAATAGGE